MAGLQQEPGHEAVIAEAAEQGSDPHGGADQHQDKQHHAQTTTEAFHGVRPPETNS